MTTENSTVKIAEETSPPEYPPDTAKHLTWGAINFIKSPTSTILDVTCFSLIGTLFICLVLCRFLEIDVSVRGAAEIVTSGGVKDIVSPVDGQVIKVFKKIEDPVKEHELIALLEMDGATPEDIQKAIDDIEGLIKKVEVETLPIDLKISPLTLPTSKVYNATVLQALVNVEHSIHDFQREQARTLALLNRNLKEGGLGTASSEIYYINRRIEFLAKKIKEMKASPRHDFLAIYIDSAEEEMGRLKTQVSSTQTKSSEALEQGFADLLRSLRIASGVLDEYKKHHEIRAPISGVIGKIIEGENIHLNVNQTVATIIPTASQFIAHIRMNSKDIVRLKKGQSVFYKVEAYPFQRFGLFTGEIVDFDQLKERPVDGKGARNDGDDSFILNATIETPEGLNDALQKRIKFIVGMRAEATVVMERKSIKDIIVDKFFNTKDTW